MKVSVAGTRDELTLKPSAAADGSDRPGGVKALRGDSAVDKGWERVRIAGYPWFHRAYYLFSKSK